MLVWPEQLKCVHPDYKFMWKNYQNCWFVSKEKPYWCEGLPCGQFASWDRNIRASLEVFDWQPSQKYAEVSIRESLIERRFLTWPQSLKIDSEYEWLARDGDGKWWLFQYEPYFVPASISGCSIDMWIARRGYIRSLDKYGIWILHESLKQIPCSKTLIKRTLS